MAVFTGNGSVGSPSFTFSSDTDTGIYRSNNNVINIATTGTSRLQIDSVGDFCIGTTVKAANSRLTLTTAADGDFAFYGISPSSNGLTGLIPDGTNGNALRWGGIGANAQTMRFMAGASSEIFRYTGPSTTGYIRLASGTGGIQFNGDTAAANALDDYEEGAWTPVYTAQTGSFATMTMNVQSARYVKVGNVVTVEAYVVTSNVDVTGASGLLYLSGLPFTSYSTTSLRRSGAFGYTGAWNVFPTAWGLEENSSKIRLYSAVGPGVTTNVSDLTTGTGSVNILWFGATYIVN